MAAHDRQQHVGGGQILQGKSPQPLADDRQAQIHHVALHPLTLLRIDCSGLEQEAVGDADLADVVQGG
ncbi:hypothetical protein [Cyanobium sp. Morenito 9A2]|uniref:hypothetical protein n=1 Tax=Cyanobium sp. Morenito 9A2 TaxID=2823718 RepID=UPI0037C0055D